MVVRSWRHKIEKNLHMVRKFYCSWVRNFAPVHGCEFSHGCEISHQFMGANFRTTVHGCEIFAPVCKNFPVLSLTSDEHNFFVRTLFEVFLDCMESPLSQEFRFMPVEDKWGSQPC